MDTQHLYALLAAFGIGAAGGFAVHRDARGVLTTGALTFGATAIGTAIVETGYKKRTGVAKSLSQLQQEIADTERQMGLSHSHLVHDRTKLENLQAELQELDDRKQKTERRLTELSELLEKGQPLDEQIRLNQQLQEELDALKAQQVAIAPEQPEQSALPQEIEDLQQTRATLQAEIALRQSELEQLLEQVAEGQTEWQDLSSEIQILEGQREQVQADIQVFERRKDLLEEMNAPELQDSVSTAPQPEPSQANVRAVEQQDLAAGLSHQPPISAIDTSADLPSQVSENALPVEDILPMVEGDIPQEIEGDIPQEIETPEPQDSTPDEDPDLASLLAESSHPIRDNGNGLVELSDRSEVIPAEPLLATSDTAIENPSDGGIEFEEDEQSDDGDLADGEQSVDMFFANIERKSTAEVTGSDTSLRDLFEAEPEEYAEMPAMAIEQAEEADEDEPTPSEPLVEEEVNLAHLFETATPKDS
ncbi:hypothetical protein [Synechococcus sp. PCC 7336]|uniref:hypothetical protein n=1 Tax=Synechococcus sp. PCC 7336 TaxID=195250 RepID=UPI00034612C7|nr:hypothetical protein [Synechococcus sp. PCC 7336]